MLTKPQVEKTLIDRPYAFSLGEIMDRLILISKIEEGLEDVKRCNMYITEQRQPIYRNGNKRPLN